MDNITAVVGSATAARFLEAPVTEVDLPIGKLLLNVSQVNLSASDLYPRIRQGITYDKWPFRLDVPVEYQDWILVAMSFVMVGFWCTPCLCGRLKNSCAKGFTKYIYTRLHYFFCVITYVNLVIVMFIVGVCPDWTVNEYVSYLAAFVSWVLLHLKKLIVSGAVLFGFLLLFKFRDRLAMAAGLEHVQIFRFNIKDWLGATKKRPIEIIIWKVDDIQSSANKGMIKANDIFVECHMGHNEPMRTRVHNNAGSASMIKESFQINIDESNTADVMTILVKDQALLVSSELARLMLSTREIFGIEDQTGKRRTTFDYTQDCFVPLDLVPRGKIWLAIAPVDDMDEERAPLMEDDALAIC